jgi:hypothetical protein
MLTILCFAEKVAEPWLKPCYSKDLEQHQCPIKSLEKYEILAAELLTKLEFVFSGHPRWFETCDSKENEYSVHSSRKECQFEVIDS